MTAALADPITPVIDTPQVVFEELIDRITTAISFAPRSLQKRIGPSEIGEECERALIARLAGLPKPVEPPNWRARVGTAIHADLCEIFTGERWLVEKVVAVGTIGGQTITGSVDLFDTATGTVIDWKSKSRTQMDKHRRHGPGMKYRVQMNLYGLGMAGLGFPVRQVMNVFLPRDGELADAFHWAEPINPWLAIDALRRAEQLHTLAQFLGPETAMKQFRPCEQDWCRTCRDVRRIRPGAHLRTTRDNPFGLSFPSPVEGKAS